MPSGFAGLGVVPRARSDVDDHRLDGIDSDNSVYTERMESAARPDHSRTPTADELAYVEEVGLYFEQTGLSRMAGRIIGWLLVCDPPEQSAADLAAVLRASKGSISTTTRSLVQGRLIARVSLPGDRRDYFRIRDDGWAERLRAGMTMVTTFRQLVERGLLLVGDDTPHRRDRLDGVLHLYAWIEREWPAFFDRYERERQGAAE